MSDQMELSEEDKAAFAAMKADAYSGKEDPAPVEEEAEAAEVLDDDEDTDEEALADTEQKKPGFVPHRKLHKEIEKRKGIEGELAKEREERLRLDERLNLIMERFKEPQKTAATAAPEPATVPNPEEDIFGAVENTTKRVSSIEEKLEAYTKQQETNARATQVINAASNAEHAFVKESPDYFDALGHLRTARIRDYQRMYPNASEQQIKQRIGQEELQFAAQALQRGESPAKAVYEWAKERGYTRQVDPAGETEQERLARKADAQSRSRTLNGGGSGGNPSTASKQRELLNMSDDDFYAMMTKKPDELRKIMMS